MGRHDMHRFTAVTITATIGLAGCGGSGSGDSSASYCDRATGAKTAFEANGGDELPDDPAELEAQFTAVTSSISALADVAPDDLADDFNSVVEAYDAVTSGLESVDYDFVDFLADPDLVATVEVLDSAEFEATTDRIDEFTEAECGFRLDDDADAAAGTTADTTPVDSIVEDSTDDSTDDPIVVDETSIEAATGAFIQIFGLDESKARCLAEKTVGLSEDEATDVSLVMGFFADCDISMAEITGSLSS
jgi:hypothetical protein